MLLKHYYWELNDKLKLRYLVDGFFLWRLGIQYSLTFDWRLSLHTGVSSAQHRMRLFIITLNNLLSLIDPSNQVLPEYEDIDAFLSLNPQVVLTLESATGVVRAWGAVDGALLWATHLLLAATPLKASSKMKLIADVNNDGDADIAILYGLDRISILSGREGGIIWESSTIPHGTGKTLVPGNIWSPKKKRQ